MAFVRRLLGVAVFGLTLNMAGATTPPTAPKLLLQNKYGPPANFVVSDSQIFWINCLGNAPAVMSAQIGSGVSTPLAKFTFDGNGALIVNSGTVYWVDQSAGTVSSVSVNGGATTVIASEQAGPFSLLMDGNNLYWVNSGTMDNNYADGSIMMKDLASGTLKVVLANQNRPEFVAIAGGKLFWTQNQVANNGLLVSSIWSQSLVNPSVPVVEVSGGLIWDIVSDGTNIYWIQDKFGGSVEAGIRTLAATGGTAKTLAENYWVAYLVMDSNNLYWTTNGDTVDSQCAVMTMPLSAGAAASKISSCKFLEGIAVDAANIYWDDNLAPTVPYAFNVFSLPKN